MKPMLVMTENAISSNSTPKRLISNRLEYNYTNMGWGWDNGVRRCNHYVMGENPRCRYYNLSRNNVKGREKVYKICGYGANSVRTLASTSLTASGQRAVPIYRAARYLYTDSHHVTKISQIPAPDPTPQPGGRCMTSCARARARARAKSGRSSTSVFCGHGGRR